MLLPCPLCGDATDQRVCAECKHADQVAAQAAKPRRKVKTTTT